LCEQSPITPIEPRKGTRLREERGLRCSLAMSLHNARSRRFTRSRGASIVEYALLLVLSTGGAAAALRATGIDVRETFASGADAIGVASGGPNDDSSGSATLPGIDPRPQPDGTR